MALQARRLPQCLQPLSPLCGFTAAALSACARMLCATLWGLLSSSQPWSSLGLHPARLQINLLPNIVQRDEGSCHPVNAGLVAIWLCQLNWEQLLSAHLSYVVVGHQRGKWPGLFLTCTPVNPGGLAHEDEGMSPDCCFSWAGDSAHPIPPPCWQPMLIPQIFASMPIFRSKKNKSGKGDFPLLCKAQSQKAFTTESDLLCWDKHCCFSTSPSGDRAQN